MTEHNNNLYKNSKASLSSEKKSASVFGEESDEAKNRIIKLFSQKKENILNIYCTAGYPHLHSTLTVMKALQNNAVDIIELGMPYSDPLADGPVIQQSNMTALENGMSVHVLFEQLKNVRDTIHIPIILMGYMNPVLQYGMENFLAAAAAIGIDGIILPDLPIHEFETEYKSLFSKYRICFIFLVTPETGEERIRKIDNQGNGFIYAVSSSSTTGSLKKQGDKNAIQGQEAYIKKLKDMHLTNPVLVGFGIKDRPGFIAAGRYSNGAIIGTAYINALKNTSNIDQSTKDFINTILK